MKIKHSDRFKNAVAECMSADDRHLELDRSEWDIVAIVMVDDLRESFSAMLTNERRYVRYDPHAIRLILKALAAYRTFTLDRIEKRLKESADDGK